MSIAGAGVFAFLTFVDDEVFSFSLPRNFGVLPDAFAREIAMSLSSVAGFVGPTNPNNNQFVTGIADSDFGQTVNLLAINLFGVNGQITDIATITGESGTTYRVGGFVSSVPEPSSLALLGAVVVGVWLSRRRRSR